VIHLDPVGFHTVFHSLTGKDVGLITHVPSTHDSFGPWSGNSDASQLFRRDSWLSRFGIASINSPSAFLKPVDPPVLPLKLPRAPPTQSGDGRIIVACPPTPAM